MAQREAPPAYRADDDLIEEAPPTYGVTDTSMRLPAELLPQHNLTFASDVFRDALAPANFLHTNREAEVLTALANAPGRKLRFGLYNGIRFDVLLQPRPIDPSVWPITTSNQNELYTLNYQQLPEGGVRGGSRARQALRRAWHSGRQYAEQTPEYTVNVVFQMGMLTSTDEHEGFKYAVCLEIAPDGSVLQILLVSLERGKAEPWKNPPAHSPTVSIAGIDWSTHTDDGYPELHITPVSEGEVVMGGGARLAVDEQERILPNAMPQYWRREPPVEGGSIQNIVWMQWCETPQGLVIKELARDESPVEFTGAGSIGPQMLSWAAIRELMGRPPQLEGGSS